MAISLDSIRRGGSDRAPIVLVHGGPGIGKSTFGACAPEPIFVRTEDGLGNLDVYSFPLAETYDDVMAALAALYDEHPFQTVVLDSLSALEPLIWKKVAADNGKTNVEDLGYGKGYVLALTYWQELMAALRGLAVRGVMPLLIAHTDIVRFDSPDTDPYDRYQIKLHKRAFQYLYEQCDVIGFATLPVAVRKNDKDDVKGRGIARGGRLLHLVEKPSHIAKNRYSMPETIPLEWDAFAAHLPGASAPASESADIAAD
jgi:hypothetical protein